MEGLVNYIIAFKSLAAAVDRYCSGVFSIVVYVY